jgi:hypothetical protein
MTAPLAHPINSADGFPAVPSGRPSVAGGFGPQAGTKKGRASRTVEGTGPRSYSLCSLTSLRYELALILLSMRSTKLSRSLVRFSNSRSLLSSSAVRSSSFSVISATVNVS